MRTALAGCVALKLLDSIVAKTAPVGRIVQTHFSDPDATERVYRREPKLALQALCGPRLSPNTFTNHFNVE